MGCYSGGFFAKTCEQMGSCESSSTSGPTTSTSSSTQTDTETDTDTGGSQRDGYRIFEMSLLDPFLYTDQFGECDEVHEIINEVVLPSELSKGTVNIVLQFPEFEPDTVQDQLMYIHRAMCDVPNFACHADGPFFISFTQDFVEGSCRPLDLPGIQPERIPTLSDPMAPCFTTAQGSLYIQLFDGIDVIQLNDALLIGAYDNFSDPQSINEGLIIGFITEDTARSVVLDYLGQELSLWTLILGGDACTPPEMPPLDVDIHEIEGVPTNGVWLYLNFSAERVSWSLDDPDPDTDTDSDTYTDTDTDTDTDTGTDTDPTGTT